jgi:uncharacterized delta-60 repeat protein
MPSDLGLVRYLPDGSLDQSFGEAGIVRTPFEAEPIRALDVLVIPGDGLLVAGAAGPNVVLARYRENGDIAGSLLDPGTAIRPFFGGLAGASATAVAIHQPVMVNAAVELAPSSATDAPFFNPPKITVAGTRRRAVGNHEEYLLSRYLPDGDSDRTFGGDGGVTGTFEVGDGTSQPSAVTVAGRSERTVVAASLTFLNGEVIGVSRHVREGSPDAEFAGDGSSFFPFTPGSSGLRPIRGNAAVADRGRVHIAGNALPPNQTWRQLAVVAFLDTGAVDRDFGREGLALAPFAEGDATARAVRTGRLGEIISAGDVADRFVVVRHRANGVLDTGFSGDGKTMVSFREGRGAALALELDPQGRVIAAGEAGRQVAAIRLLASGQLDAGFGNNGRVRTAVGDEANDETSRALAVAVDSRGRVLLACEVRPPDGVDLGMRKRHL